MTVWVEFMDMHSGGGQKVKGFDYIFIESRDALDGMERFEKEFDRDPNNVSCETCGGDYAISVHDTAEEVMRDNWGRMDRPWLLIDINGNRKEV